jgi:chromosome segregation ATPase
MRDLLFHETGCEPAPTPGPRAVLILLRRAIRRILRPIFERLVQILENLRDRLDDLTHRLDGLTHRLDGLTHRLDAHEARVEQRFSAMFVQAEGLSAYVSQLTEAHHELTHQVQAQNEQIKAMAPGMTNLGIRQGDLEDKMQAVHALHWDHVALARRLAVLEDRLTAAEDAEGTIDEGDSQPSIPFLGLDEGARSRVG